jgi:dTDP-4-amino-4,6-dideoxygalactose transaminase
MIDKNSGTSSSFPPEVAAEVAEMVLVGATSYEGAEEQVRQFEEAAAAAFGARHCLAVSSGTAALYLALAALGVSPGVEVISPAYSFFRTASPVMHLGGRLVLADSLPDNENVDPAAVEACITPRTEGIVVVHWAGHVCDMDAIWHIAERHSLWVVEDAAHAHGAHHRGKPLGEGRSDAVCYSLQAKKLVAAGQGGLLCTASPDLWETALLLGYFRPRLARDVAGAVRRPFVHSGLGLNFQIAPLGLPLARYCLQRLEQVIAARADYALALDRALATSRFLAPPHSYPYATTQSHYMYRPQVRPEVDEEFADAYLAALAEAGVPIARKRDVIMADEPMYRGQWDERWRANVPGSVPNARRLSAHSTDLQLANVWDAALAARLTGAIGDIEESFARLPARVSP